MEIELGIALFFNARATTPPTFFIEYKQIEKPSSASCQPVLIRLPPS